MSVLSVVPELVSVAAGDLSGVGSAIAEANSLAAGSTLGVVAPAADSVSAELEALFGGHAQTYQTVSTQANAFHQEFVSTLANSSAAYSRAEAESASGLGRGHTGEGLRVLGSRQHQPAGGGAGSRLWQPGRPALWKPGMSDPRLVTPRHSLPAGSRLWHPGLAGFKGHNVFAPQPFTPHNELLGGVLAGFGGQSTGGVIAKTVRAIEQIIQNQIGYLKLIGTSLVDFVKDELKAIIGLPEAFGQSIKDLLHGNIKGAMNDILKGFGHLFINGHELLPDMTNVPGWGSGFEYDFTGALPDLWHILQIPASMTQNLADILKPLGFGIAGKLVQHLANPLEILATFGHMYADPNGRWLVMNPALALAFDVLGAPILSLNAFEDSLQTAFSALTSGHPLTAIIDLAETPLKTGKAFLFGQGTLSLPYVAADGDIHIHNINLGGIFAPLGYEWRHMPHGDVFFDSGTQTGGLVPALVAMLPPKLQDPFHSLRRLLDGITAKLLGLPALNY